MSNDNLKREHRFTSEVRASASGDAKKLSGYAAVYNVPTVIGGQFNEVLRAGCFDACLADDPDVRALWNHSDLTVLGRTTAGTLRLRSDDKGLFYEVDLPETQAAQDLWKSVQRKDVTGSSFGFYALNENWLPATKPGELPTREIVTANVFDVSPCPFPAYDNGPSVNARSLVPEAMRAENVETIQRRHRAAVLLAEHEAWKQQQAEKEQAAIDAQLRTRLEVLKLL
jgi:HK97 family phage prohead protease